MSKSTSLLIFLLIPILLTSSASVSDPVVPDDDEQAQALLAIKQDWGNPTALSSWKAKDHDTGHGSSLTYSYCNWVGVACNDNKQVTALSFQNFQIANRIPDSICSLKNLSYIDFCYNNLTREFPTTLYSCTALQYLDLSNNGFSGSLPDDIDRFWPGMEHLNLSSNGFVGTVPRAIAGFSKLRSLLLDYNSFDGSYPAAAMGNNLTNLETLTLAGNPFEPSPVPVQFGKLTKLDMLWMSKMNLIGAIPDELSSLTELTLLDLSENKLDGGVPPWVWKLPELQYLYLYKNNLVGGILPDVTAVNMLQLDLSSNRLTDPIPDAIGNMTKLNLLFLYNNSISGPIPTSVGLLPNLKDVRLFDNMLTGPLPPELGKHAPLWNLEVCNNHLTGEVPDTLCVKKNLQDLVLFGNNFSGELPSSLAECDTLDNIMIHDNRFVGDFPEQVWWAFPKLTTVKIQNNNFTGVLRAEISPNISRIEMGNNRFSGAVPESAAGLLVFKAEHNRFSQGLPANMSKLANLIELSLAGNDLSGSVPPSIVALKRLTSLNLSRNRISGPIPESIGQLSDLNFLDLSNNSLVGNIPMTFDKLHLSFLDLSYNQLAGMVPLALQATSFNGSFHGNPGLCTGQFDSGLPIPLCPGDGGHGSSTRRRIRTVIVVAVIIPSVALVGFAIIAVRWLVLSRKNKQRDVTSWKMVPFRPFSFTEHDVLSKISEDNVIGRGGSGKVYLIHLDGCDAKEEEHEDAARATHYSTVAVKKIGNAGKPDASLDKEFEAEVASLGALRHGNIVNLLCCISGGDDDTKLLVYEYMENGSLDRWLHRRGRRHDDAPPLDWPTRLSVAVDVARGLSYMHHDFTRPVVHRDVKCSNILLDCGFRAKIADFGLARVLAKSGVSEAASAVCGTFGYIAPEYVNRAKVSDKVDVYSFGVVLLELATGRGPHDGGAESGSCLAKWAAKRYRDGDLCVADLVDAAIRDAAYLDDMVAVFELGVVCTREDPSCRPPMSEVLRRLLQCYRSYGMSSDDGEDEAAAAKDPCGVFSLECMV